MRHDPEKGGAPHYDLDLLRDIPLTEICEKLNIVLDRNNRACCPFHSESTPSFHINPKNFYKCFGCAAGGDSIKFVEQYMEVDFKEAIRWLAEMKNVQPGVRPGLKPIKPSARPGIAPPAVFTPADVLQQQHLNTEMKALLLRVAQADPAARNFTEWGAKRGFGFDVLNLFTREGSLGATAGGGGLAFLYENATKIRYDLRDSRSCRWVAGKAKHSVWRLQHLHPDDHSAYIFEGETDLMAAASCHTRHPDGFIAAPGASWHPDYATLSNIGMHRHVFLAFDNDTAGMNATSRLAVALSGVPGCVVNRFDWGNFKGVGDIGELLATCGKKSLAKALDMNWVKV